MYNSGEKGEVGAVPVGESDWWCPSLQARVYKEGSPLARERIDTPIGRTAWFDCVFDWVSCVCAFGGL